MVKTSVSLIIVAAVICGLTFEVAADGLMSMLVPSIFGGRSSSNHKRMEQLAELAAQKSGSNPDDFWKSAIKDTVDRCTPEFAHKLAAEFEKIATEDENEADFQWLLNQIQVQMMENCSEEFGNKVQSFFEVIDKAEGLDVIGEEFEADGEKLPEDDENLAKRVARVMKSRGEFADEAAFKENYLQRGPCTAVYKKLGEKGFEGYEKFLRLAMIPEYHAQTYWSHLDIVDILAACDYIQNGDKILQLAYKKYQSGDTQLDSDSDEGEDEEDLD